MLTLQELKDKMTENLSEIDVMELLEISTEDLVERFSDKIEDKYEQILNQLED
jgi:hypothetical protein